MRNSFRDLHLLPEAFAFLTSENALLNSQRLYFFKEWFVEDTFPKPFLNSELSNQSSGSQQSTSPVRETGNLFWDVFLSVIFIAISELKFLLVQLGSIAFYYSFFSL